MESTWEQDRRVLEAAVSFIEDNNWSLFPQAYDLAPIVGIAEDDVGRSLLRLDGAYIEVGRVFDGISHTMVKRIYPQARRAVGQWPTPEAVAESFLAQMREAADAEPDQEKRSKLKETVRFLGSGGKDLLINLMASVIAKSAGIG